MNLYVKLMYFIGYIFIDVRTDKQFRHQQLSKSNYSEGNGMNCRGQPITDGLSDQTRRSLERQKSTHTYYTPSLSLAPSQTDKSKLSLLRYTSRSSSLYSSRFYPALLSRTAQELHRRLRTRTLVKDDIEYSRAFTGKEAVVWMHENHKTDNTLKKGAHLLICYL